MKLIPDSHWLFLHNWYDQSYVQVKWNASLSTSFQVTKGMKQGSLLSPYLFNIFINDLLKKLTSMNPGVRIKDFHLNVLAYADDVNLISTTVAGLQKMIDECDNYAQMWRMKFNPTKTNIVCIGKHNCIKPPVWTLGDSVVGLSDDTTVLGVNFTSTLNSNMHIRSRTRKCQQGMFKLSSMGVSYPGLNSDVKAFLWNSIGCPILTYGMESLTLSDTDIKGLKTSQGNIIKRIMGVNKRSHHSSLLKALGIPPVDMIIQNNCLRLYRNIFKVDSPARDLQSILLADYLLTGSLTKGTLLERIVKAKQNPLEIVLGEQTISATTKYDHCTYENGIIDSLRFLLNHDDYNKPWSEEHILVTLLTKAF